MVTVTVAEWLAPGSSPGTDAAPGQERVVGALHRVEREVVARRRRRRRGRPGVLHRVGHRERGAGRPDRARADSSSSRVGTRFAARRARPATSTVVRDDLARRSPTTRGSRRSWDRACPPGSTRSPIGPASGRGCRASSCRGRRRRAIVDAVVARRLEAERRHAERRAASARPARPTRRRTGVATFTVTLERGADGADSPDASCRCVIGRASGRRG